MPTRMKGYLTIGILITTLIISSVWYFISPTVSMAEKKDAEEKVEMTPVFHSGRYVVIRLDKMTLELRDSETIITTIPLVSIGKKGSYYETIGGAYINDYKEPLHFSSIGHVYMPFSIHIFGNFFIHGIPYYPDGTKVSSTFSGGCIRLADDDAKLVFDFINKGTPIIITSGGEYDFSPTSTTTATIETMEMARLMVATISLEVLTQDNEILNNDNISTTTRRALLPKLLKEKDDSVSVLYAQAIGENAFIEYMNKKAESLGLINTIFANVQGPVKTTEKDYARFMEYINNYKPYLLTEFRD